MVKLKDLINSIDKILNPENFQDHCPNGLQVYGGTEVNKVVTGVTASQALIDYSIENQADTILVHHGYFWKGEDPCVVGVKRQRLIKLLQNNINLIAYHLPLDFHPVYGNNIQLANILNLKCNESCFTDCRDLFCTGTLPKTMTLDEFSNYVGKKLNHKPLSIYGGDHKISRVAWIAGAAQGEIGRAAYFGVDAYLSGEISESTVHLARELKIHYVAAGHYATERYGIQALIKKLHELFIFDSLFFEENITI